MLAIELMDTLKHDIGDLLCLVPYAQSIRAGFHFGVRITNDYTSGFPLGPLFLFRLRIGKQSLPSTPIPAAVRRRTSTSGNTLVVEALLCVNAGRRTPTA